MGSCFSSASANTPWHQSPRASIPEVLAHRAQDAAQPTGNQGGQLQHSTRQVPAAAPACSSRQQAGLPPAGPDAEAPALTAEGPPPAAPAPRFVCAICFDDVEEELRVVELPGSCGQHDFCRACLAEHIRTQLQAGAYPVTCPAYHCRQQLPDQMCLHVLQAAGQHAACRQLRRAAGLRSGRLLHCPAPGCGHVLRAPSPHADLCCTCPHCRHSFCSSCRVPWHLGQTCQQYRAELACEQAPSPELAPLLALQRSKGWQWCPGCGHLVEKRDGCWHMVCRCGCSFCYGCGHWQAHHRGGYCPAGPAPASPLVPKTITAARSTTQPQSQPGSLSVILRSLAAQHH